MHLHHIEPLAEQGGGGGGGLKAGKMSRITQSRLLQVGRSRHRGVVQFAPATFIIGEVQQREERNLMVARQPSHWPFNTYGQPGKGM